jgi:Mn2+/Fe2+ NRAMP family transporter
LNNQEPVSDPRRPEGIERPPISIGGTLLRIGPGLIIAGNIVGSGELIATTAAGASAGFWLLWLIVIGCVVKVFTQVEFGRYTITRGEASMVLLNEVPGPRFRRGGNWMIWVWFIAFFFGIAQLGGIVGGVGQALSISAPLTENGKRNNEIVDCRTELDVKQRYVELLAERHGGLDASQQAQAEQLRAEITALAARVEELGEPPESKDDQIWATILAVVTAGLLVVGRYGMIQSLTTALVVLFTFVTILNLILLQLNPTLAVSGAEFISGLRFELPPAPTFGENAGDPYGGIRIALAAMGIIGVGAAELVFYPYWCVEKGYARYSGPRDDSEGWAERARGWMRVLKVDAWCSAAIYTFATVAFYLVGAATLGRFELEAKGTEMVRTLAVMYEPVFGEHAAVVFLFGAVAVLYSTFFVSNASHARVVSDALRVVGFPLETEAARKRAVRIFSGIFPFLCLSVYLFVQAPVAVVYWGGTIQGIMLPMLAGCALYFRYRRSDGRLKPGKVWDAFLWLSALAMLCTGVATVVLNVQNMLNG